MKVLVCGGKRFGEMPGEAHFLFVELDKLHAIHKFSEVIQGGQLGADNLAVLWSQTRGIECDPHKFDAEWDLLGRAAGPIRNRDMLLHGRPELVVAFPGHIGTANMVSQAKWRGVRVLELKML